MSDKIYIYCIYFPTSKKCYIGQTNNLNGRMQDHIYKDSFISRALCKYDDWQISILHICKTRDEANRIEIEEIRNFNSIRPNGYNLTRGGDGLFGFSHSEKSKRIMSEAKKGNQYSKGNKAFLDRTHTEESKEKIRQSKIGRERSKETKERIANTLRGRKQPVEVVNKRVATIKARGNPNAHSTQAEMKRLKTRLKRLECDNE